MTLATLCASRHPAVEALMTWLAERAVAIAEKKLGRRTR